MQKINWLAVLACVVLLFVLGFVWYGPIFGDAWMGHVGLDRATVEANPPGASVWIANIVSSIIPMILLAWILGEMNVSSWMKGAFVGLAIGFAFVFLHDMTGNLFAERPYGLSWITGGYDMVGLALAGAILGAWRKN